MDLDNFVALRSQGINRNTVGNIARITSMIWDVCQGIITQQNLNTLTNLFLTRYHSEDSKKKCFNYTRAFLRYLYKIRMDTKILSFLAIFEIPKFKKERKMMTPRIIVDDDIKRAIAQINSDPILIESLKQRYGISILFLALSGQRPQTMGRIRVEQFKQALSQNPPVLKVEAAQDKNRMEHWVPLHPVLILLIKKLMEGKKDGANLFTYQGLQDYLKKHPVSLKMIQGKLETKDCRKYFEQKSDEIGFTDANKSFIMTHGCSGVAWKNYKQFLPENVYARYMEKWGNVKIDS